MLNQILMLNRISVDSIDKYPKFETGGHVIIVKYKNIFSKGYIPKWSEVLLLPRLKIQFHELMSLMILMLKELLELFMKNNCWKQIKKNLE